MLDKLFLTFIDDQRVFAATTLRFGGVSKPPFDELNLGFQTGDYREAVNENRTRLFRELPPTLSPFIFTYQSHSTVLKKVTRLDAGKGLESFETGVVADALYTTDLKLPLAIFHADCVPVFLIHKHRPLIAMIHAGTPGTIQRITASVINDLCEKEQCQPHDFQVTLGPALDFAHHPLTVKEVDDLLDHHPTCAPGIKMISGQFYLDTPLLNYLQCIDAGMSPKDITVHSLDTFSNPKQFFSAERDEKTGRHVSFVYLK